MASEIYNNSVICAAVPEGWKAFEAIDSGGNLTLKKFHVYKNAETPMDIFRKAGITVCYFAKGDIYLSPRSFYDNVEDIEPFELGEHLWQGYTCTSLGYPYTMLESHCDGVVFQVMILTENNGEKIALEDPDVTEILESIDEA